MEENYNKWLVNDLTEYLLQHNITKTDIKGTGKNGNVIKADLVRASKKVSKLHTLNINTVEKNTYDIIPQDVIPQIFDNLPIKTTRLINKQSLKSTEKRTKHKDYIVLSEKGKTSGLKRGDIVLYDVYLYNNHQLDTFSTKVIAFVYQVTSTKKVKIQALHDYDITFNTRSLNNIDRKYLTIIKLSDNYFNRLDQRTQTKITFWSNFDNQI